MRRMGDHTVRSSDQKAVFDIASHHRTNKEALVEILALSNCQYLVHGLSAVSESSIWINIGLHNRSVNLEDPGHITPPMLGQLVRMSFEGFPESDWPHAERTDEWWKQNNPPKPMQPLTRKACQGYNGVLLISAIDRKSSAASAFFVDVLNQLLYAKRNNLIPWVYLQNGTDLIMDSAAHPLSTWSSSAGGSNIEIQTASVLPSSTCPVDVTANVEPGVTTTLRRHGIWDSYFTPVSDFSLSDPTCSKLTVMVMDGDVVSRGLKASCDHTVKAWRYDHARNWNPNQASLHEWFGQMRPTANAVVKEFYSFRPHIIQRAELVNPVVDGQACLGVHVRVGDKKGEHTKKIKADRYLPYLEAFARAGGKTIYLASDSHRAIQYIMKSMDEQTSMLIRTQGANVVRTYKDYPTHFIDNHDRVNSETLVDILALSKCSLLLHSHSTVSEAAIYLNLGLHNNSVNLEDPDRLSTEQFENLSRTLLASKE